MKTAWLPDMPINVATLLLDPRLATQSDAKIGRVIRVLSRAWIVGEPTDVPASVRPIIDSIWPEYAEQRTKLHEKHRALSEAGSRGGRPTKEREALKPSESQALSQAESTYPYPYPKKTTLTHRARSGRRGTRLPDDAVLTDEWRQIAVKHGVADPPKTFTEFKNYWTSLPGQRATKLDWRKTWENRCIDVAARQKPIYTPDRPNLRNSLAPVESRQNVPSYEETRRRIQQEDEEQRRMVLLRQAREAAGA